MRKEIIRMSIDGEKVSTFPMGVDNAFFEAGKGRGRKLNGQPYIIVSNRQLYPIYNLSSLIRAIPIVLKQEPEVKFLIAGEGPERENLESEAKNSNVASVRFLGRVPNEEMPELLGRTDIYVSTSPHDGTSVSLLEAMATGAFPIVTDIPANREWIFDGENGFLVSVDKEGVLADKILGAIRDQTLLEKSRIRNLSMVGEKVLWPENIEKIRRIYEQLCQK